MKKATQECAGAVTSVFWNIDTCPVPRGFDAHLVGPCMKRYLEKLGYSGPLTMCVVGTLTDVSDEVLRAVSSTGFLVYIDPYGSYSLSGYMFKWANEENPPPANIMLITHSTDRDHAIDLRMLQGEGYNIIRPYPLGPASSTNAWESFLLAESGALEKDYPIVKVESSWVCTVCDDLTGRGFDNFTTHISSQGHAYRKSQWTTFQAPPEDEIAVETRVEPPWDWSPALQLQLESQLESQPPSPPPPLPLAPQVCFGCNVTIIPQPWEIFPFVCRRCANLANQSYASTDTILPKPTHWFATPSEFHGNEPKLANQSLGHENQMLLQQIDDPRDKLLHECDVLRNRLQECNVKFHIEEESKLIMDSSSPSEAIELLAASDNRIGLLIAETQLLSEEVEKLKLTTSEDNPGTNYVIRKMLTEVLIDNARLRKQVNSVLRCSLSGQF